MSEVIFTPPHPLRTPVLFLVFNRPDTTTRVFEAIRKAKPPRIYIAADGPRENKPGEEEKVKAVREYVISHIDWNCEIKTLFRKKNLGCKMAVSSAITWFFENEEMGIILEDDTLPSQSFFWFCEELLEMYKDDVRVWHIGGYSLQSDLIEWSYRFSRLIPIWGWATWKRSWNSYDVNMSSFDDSDSEIYTYFSKYSSRVKNTFKEYIDKKTDTWDIQWAYTCVKNSAFSIIPVRSLIKNIGFNKEATHTKSYDKINSKINHYELEFPLKHPPKEIDVEMIRLLDEDYLSIFYRTTFISKIKNFIKELLK